MRMIFTTILHLTACTNYQTSSMQLGARARQSWLNF